MAGRAFGSRIVVIDRLRLMACEAGRAITQAGLDLEWHVGVTASPTTAEVHLRNGVSLDRGLDMTAQAV